MCIYIYIIHKSVQLNKSDKFFSSKNQCFVLNINMINKTENSGRTPPPFHLMDQRCVTLYKKKNWPLFRTLKKKPWKVQNYRSIFQNMRKRSKFYTLINSHLHTDVRFLWVYIVNKYVGILFSLKLSRFLGRS